MELRVLRVSEGGDQLPGLVGRARHQAWLKLTAKQRQRNREASRAGVRFPLPGLAETDPRRPKRQPSEILYFPWTTVLHRTSKKVEHYHNEITNRAIVRAWDRRRISDPR